MVKCKKKKSFSNHQDMSKQTLNRILKSVELRFKSQLYICFIKIKDCQNQRLSLIRCTYFCDYLEN